MTRVLAVGVSTATLRDLAITADGAQLLATGAEESLNLSRVPLAPDAFQVTIPEGTEPTTIDELRLSGPLAEP